MSDTIAQMKLHAAIAALEYVGQDQVIGIGSGSTVDIFIEQLAARKGQIAGTVASSERSSARLKSFGIPVLDFNSIDDLPIYIDGADAFNSLKQLVKGGCGFLTREKILASAAKKFVCIVDGTKKPSILGQKAVPLEVIPMARSSVARQIVHLKGQPQYRDNYVTDNGNVILDVFGWEITEPLDLEYRIKQIPGVVENGIFAHRPADIIIIGNEQKVTTL